MRTIDGFLVHTGTNSEGQGYTHNYGAFVSDAYYWNTVTGPNNKVKHDRQLMIDGEQQFRFEVRIPDEDDVKRYLDIEDISNMDFVLQDFDVDSDTLSSLEGKAVLAYMNRGMFFGFYYPKGKLNILL